MRVAICGLASLAAACAQPAPLGSPSGQPAGSQVAPVPSPAAAEIEAYDYRTRLDRAGEFDVRILAGSAERSVPVARIGTGEQARPVATPSTGTLRVVVRFNSGGRTVATRDLELPLKPDWRWGLALHVTARNPTEGCMGCFGVRSTPIPGSTTGEQLHVVWGGNSISSPVVY